MYKRQAEDIPETLVTEFKTPADVLYFDGFKDMPEEDVYKRQAFEYL